MNSIKIHFTTSKVITEPSQKPLLRLFRERFLSSGICPERQQDKIPPGCPYTGCGVMMK